MVLSCLAKVLTFRPIFAHDGGVGNVALSLPLNAISPWLEMGAYEALWADAKVWFKSIREKFDSRPGSLPSDFFIMQENVPREYAARADGILQQHGIRKYGIRLRAAGEYPSKLRQTHPLELLYYQGFWDLVETPCVAIVGTRRPSEDAIKRTERLTSLLAHHGYTIVSGLAAGIDTVAHTTAIRECAPTIAVIGTPLSECYPKENGRLQMCIAREHLLISQVPVCRYTSQNWQVNRSFFPERNVTMSALSDATIIVEASDTSGTLFQARAALKQRRLLFILESCFHVPGLKWPRTYEKRGAIRVSEYGEIIDRLKSLRG